ncbi:hypothetical protein G7Z17_g11273 [Cylindrodendrum hubeiense]|uniref:Uncharacterized protein n=1 Tax=Cylindrodendrum hubeiense TaxID=595255 RepID=A0A9P5H376_9HYPO|nr:hypothetical protein G7Z17_g11273 [Cylindrodendrum hubeiense]
MPSYAHSFESVEASSPPENAGVYRTKPLPPPPSAPDVPVRSTARQTKRLSIFPSVSAAGNSVEDLPPTARPASLPRRPVSRCSAKGPSSMPGTPIAEHRLSLKAQQLTGQNVGFCFDWSPTRGFSPVASPVLIRDDSSSNYSQSLDELVLEEDYVDLPTCSGCSMPTLLEDDIEHDCGGATSNHSSSGQKSPQPLMQSASSDKRASSVYSSTPSIIEPSADSDDQFDADSDSWQMSQSYNHFSDTETADEYHRITSNLAVLDKQRGRNLDPALARSRSLTSRLSGTAKSLFNRRREPPRSVSSAHGSFAGGDRPPRTSLSPSSALHPQDALTPLSTSSLHPPEALSTPSHSVFETSDDEGSELEEGPVREVLRDFFHRRSEERSTHEAGSPSIPRSVPHHHTKSSDGSPKLRSKHSSKDKSSNAKMMQMAMAEKRQHSS